MVRIVAVGAQRHEIRFRVVASSATRIRCCTYDGLPSLPPVPTAGTFAVEFQDLAASARRPTRGDSGLARSEVARHSPGSVSKETGRVAEPGRSARRPALEPAKPLVRAEDEQPNLDEEGEEAQSGSPDGLLDAS